jgi:excinuclease ABC subunit B
MKKAIDEMNRRRIIQTEYNATNKIIPESINKSIQEFLVKQDKQATTSTAKNEEDEHFSRKDAPKLIKNLEKKMHAAAKNLEFEKAAELRDMIKRIREKDLSIIA